MSIGTLVQVTVCSKIGVRFAAILVALMIATPASARPGRWTRLIIPAPSVWSLVVASPPSEDLFVAAQAAFGDPAIDIYVSHDRGLSWSVLARPSVGFSVPPIIVTTPANPATIYVGTGGYSGEAMARSDDGGKSWTLIGPKTNAQRLTTIAIDPSNSSQLYATFKGAAECDGPGCQNVGGGLFVSADRGESWKELAPGFFEAGATGVILDPRHVGSVYGSSVFGVYASQDSGRAWRVLPKMSCFAPAPTPYSPGDYALVLAVGARSEIYARSEWFFEGPPPGNVCSQTQVSNDGGVTWSFVAWPSPASVYSMSVNPANRNEILANSYPEIFLSEDSGVTWRPFYSGDDGLAIYDAAFSSDGRTIYGVDDSHVYRYDREVSAIESVAKPIPVGIGGR